MQETQPTPKPTLERVTHFLLNGAAMLAATAVTAMVALGGPVEVASAAGHTTAPQQAEAAPQPNKYPSDLDGLVNGPASAGLTAFGAVALGSLMFRRKKSR